MFHNRARSPDGYTLPRATLHCEFSDITAYVFLLVCDRAVMNVTAVICASTVSVLDIQENDGI